MRDGKKLKIRQQQGVGTLRTDLLRYIVEEEDGWMTKLIEQLTILHPQETEALERLIRDFGYLGYLNTYGPRWRSTESAREEYELNRVPTIRDFFAGLFLKYVFKFEVEL